MGVLNKDIIETWIIPHLTVGSRGFEPTVSVEEIINAIFYRLKTGCQWRELPTRRIFQ
jgi:transposase